MKQLRINDLPNAQGPRGNHSVYISVLHSLPLHAALDLDRTHTLPSVDLRAGIQCVWISEFLFFVFLIYKRDDDKDLQSWELENVVACYCHYKYGNSLRKSEST